MKITRIAITRHRLALDPPFRAAWDSLPRVKFDAYVVRVETDAGLTGIAGTDTALAGFEGHEHLFLGRDAREIDRHNRILANIQFHYGRCWPIDIALWDIAGQVAGEPLWRLLGGREGRVRAYLSCGTLREAGAVAALAEQAIALGYAAMKIRFHRPDWRDDVACVAAVRARVGDRLALMVDCNQGWRMPWDAADSWTLARAREVAQRLQELGVLWMEEPLHRGDYAGMAALRGATSVRIAGGEMTRELHELDTLVDRGCLDVLQTDCVLTGGITGIRAIARRAMARGMSFTPHTWSNGLGVLANVQLAAGVDADTFVEFPFDPPEWGLERRDFMLAEALACGPDGYIRLPARPGLGAVLDETMLKKTAF